MNQNLRLPGAAAAPPRRRFMETLRSIEARAAEGPISIGELSEVCGHQGQTFFAIFLALPFLQPIPLPGISNAIGILLVIIGVNVGLQRAPWMPRFLASIVVQPDHVLRICRRLEQLLGRIERYVQPRVQWLFARPWFRLLNASVWVLHALLFSLPFPIPLSNFIPALSILLLALGILEEDLRLVVVAHLAGVVNLLFFFGVLVLPAIGWFALSK